jgi:hypothetical protein
METDTPVPPGHAVLCLALDRLPVGEQCFAISRVTRECAAWAAPRAAALAAHVKAAEAESDVTAALACFSVPLWLLQEAWPGLTPGQRLRAAARAAAHGDTATLSWALRAQSYGDDEMVSSTLICTAAAAGGHVEALQTARAAGCAWSDAVTHKGGMRLPCRRAGVGSGPRLPSRR